MVSATRWMSTAVAVPYILCHPIDVPMDVDESGQNGNGSSRKRESIVTDQRRTKRHRSYCYHPPEALHDLEKLPGKEGLRAMPPFQQPPPEREPRHTGTVPVV